MEENNMEDETRKTIYRVVFFTMLIVIVLAFGIAIGSTYYC